MIVRQSELQKQRWSHSIAVGGVHPPGCLLVIIKYSHLVTYGVAIGIGLVINPLSGLLGETFLRMIGIILVVSFFVGYFLVFANVKNFMFFHFQDADYVEEIKDTSTYLHCMVRRVFHHASSFLVVVGVPVFECLVYPLLWKYEATITIFKRFITGMCFLFISHHQLLLAWYS